MGERVAVARVSCVGSYHEGCRCDRCRAYNNKGQRDRVRRRAYGIQAGSDLLPIEPYREKVAALHGKGLTALQVAELVGTDRRTVQRIMTSPARKYVTRDMAERIDTAAVRYMDSVDPLELGAILIDSSAAKWMARSLGAMGWPTKWLGEQVGWSSKFGASDFNPLVTRRVFYRLRSVFLEHHDQSGPSHLTRLRHLRAGWFPSYCYEWETSTPDFRPIPGSLHPDLVVEVCTFANPRPVGMKQHMVDRMAGWGQYPDEVCAHTAIKNWASVMGREWHGTGPYCWDRKHKHKRLPEIWRTT